MLIIIIQYQNGVPCEESEKNGNGSGGAGFPLLTNADCFSVTVVGRLQNSSSLIIWKHVGDPR